MSFFFSAAAPPPSADSKARPKPATAPLFQAEEAAQNTAQASSGPAVTTSYSNRRAAAVAESPGETGADT